MWCCQQSKRSKVTYFIWCLDSTSPRCQTWNFRVCVCILLTLIIALLVLHTFLLFKWEWCLQNNQDQDLPAANRDSLVTPDTHTISRERANPADALHISISFTPFPPQQTVHISYSFLPNSLIFITVYQDKWFKQEECYSLNSLLPWNFICQTN